MTYLDRAFCSSDCVNRDCTRNFTPQHEANAEKWWGGPGAPVAFMDLKTGCRDYEKPKETR